MDDGLRRVGAILSSDSESVRLLGYGVLLGDLSPPFGPFGMSLDEFRERMKKLGCDDPEPYLNPCIRLDGGRYVWGCQCWWGDEEAVRESIGSRSVEAVEIDSIPPLA